jgi:hypothetical protein
MPRTQSLSRPGGQLELAEGIPRSLLVWGLDKKAWTREKDVIDVHGEDVMGGVGCGNPYIYIYLCINSHMHSRMLWYLAVLRGACIDLQVA